MRDIQQPPTQQPTLKGDAAGSAIMLLRTARAMGLDTGPMPARLDLSWVRRIARTATAAGIGRDAALALREEPLSVDRIPDLIDQLTEGLRESPLPRQELEQIGEVLDIESVGRLVNVSPMSLRRYASGSRAAPDDVAARVHWLALTVSDLRGAYNEIGVRRWFDRPRATLHGRAPVQILTGRWDPDDPDVQSVRSLASVLTGPGIVA